MKISIASYSFHGLIGAGLMDIFGYIESAKYRYRLDAADIWNGLLKSTDEEFVRKVKRALDEREMCVSNYHIDGIHLWDNDPAKREQNYKNAQLHLKVAEILEAKTIRIDTGGAFEPINQEQLDFIATRYREYAQRAQDMGAKLGPETHWGLSLNIDNMVKIAEAVNHPGYGILHHIGRWHNFGSGEVPVEQEPINDARIAPWVAHTHVDPRIARDYLPGRIKIFKDAGYTGYWGIELGSGVNEHNDVAWILSEIVRVIAA